MTQKGASIIIIQWAIPSNLLGSCHGSYEFLLHGFFANEMKEQRIVDRQEATEKDNIVRPYYIFQSLSVNMHIFFHSFCLVYTSGHRRNIKSRMHIPKVRWCSISGDPFVPSLISIRKCGTTVEYSLDFWFNGGLRTIPTSWQLLDSSRIQRAVQYRVLLSIRGANRYCEECIHLCRQKVIDKNDKETACTNPRHGKMPCCNACRKLRFSMR